MKFVLLQITETWLHENTPTNLINIPSYNFVHKIRGNKRGGGVGFYMHENLIFKERLVTIVLNLFL